MDSINRVALIVQEFSPINNSVVAEIKSHASDLSEQDIAKALRWLEGDERIFIHKNSRTSDEIKRIDKVVWVK
tara:strand:- start:147 stop:365 length:219 start_codon:yes stop_codon:yes gene_type:complete